MKPVNTVISLTLAYTLLSFTTASFADSSLTPASNMDPAQKARIEEVIHQYIIKKPEVILEALQILQRRQYEEAQQTVKDTQQNAGQFANMIFQQSNDPVAGNPKGKITVVEFFDYQCPHCIDMVPVMDAILKTNPNVRVVFKEFPVRGPQSELAARAALAANKQQKYNAFSHALLTANKPLTEDNIYQIAKTVNIDVDKLKKDMNDASVDKQLKANLKLAQDLKLFGTPAFFISKTDIKDGKGINYIPGQMNQSQLQDAINKAAK